MEQPNDKIGKREYIAIIVLMIGTKLTDDTPALLYKSMQNAAWMAPIIIGIIAVIPIYLLIRVIGLYNGKNLMDIIVQLLGKYIGVSVLLLLWVLLSSAIFIDTGTYTDIIGTMYFPKTPTIVIYGTLMGVCAYGAKRGIEQVGSVAWALFPYIKISLLIALVLTLILGNTSFLFPIFGPGEWEIVKDSSQHVSIFVDFLYLGFLVPYIKSTKDFRRGTWIALLFIVIELTLSLAAFVLLFDYNAVQMLNYPFHETIRYIYIGFLTHIETFFFPFWLIATFVRFTAYLYLNAILFGKIFKISEFEYIIPSLATLFVFTGMIPDNPTFTLFHFREILLYVTTPVFFFLPCLLWLIARLKGDFKNEKAKSSI